MAFKLESYEMAQVDEQKSERTIKFLKNLALGLPDMMEMKKGFVIDIKELIKTEAAKNPSDRQKIAGWEQEIRAAEEDIFNLQRQMLTVPKKIERLQNLLTAPADAKKVLTIPGSQGGTTRAELSDLLLAVKERREQEITFEEKLLLDDMREKLEGAKNKFDNDGTFDKVQITLSKRELGMLSALPNFGPRIEACALLLEIEEQMVAEKNRLIKSNSKTADVFTYPLAQIRESKQELLTDTRALPILHTNDPTKVMERTEGLLEQLHKNVIEKEEVSHPFKKFLVDTKNKVAGWARKNFRNSLISVESQFKTAAISSSFEMFRKASVRRSATSPDLQALPAIEIGNKRSPNTLH